MDKIVVLDFGSQYSHLICRRIRDFAVYAELLPYGTSIDKIKELSPKGLILSGGPASVYEQGAPKPDFGVFDMGIPILGICYGHQLVVNKHGGSIKRANKEYGASTLNIQGGRIFDGLGGEITAWMSHGDEAEKIPSGFKVIGSTENSAAAAIVSESESVFGLQFHPEVAHTEHGSKILENFAVNICGAKKEWTMESFAKASIEQMPQNSRVGEQPLKKLTPHKMSPFTDEICSMDVFANDSMVHSFFAPHMFTAKFSNIFEPCSVWATSGWNCRPNTDSDSETMAAAAEFSVLPMTLNPDGIFSASSP